MADFCRQCSLALFGEDFGDLAGLGDGGKLEPGHGWRALCEGCGDAIVTDDGTCIAENCLKEHGRQE